MEMAWTQMLVIFKTMFYQQKNKNCIINTREFIVFNFLRTTFSVKIVHTWIGQSFVVPVNDQWKFSRRKILGCTVRINDLKQIKVNDVNNAYLAMISYQSFILHFKQFKREPAFECGWTEKSRSKKIFCQCTRYQITTCWTVQAIFLYSQWN